MRHWTLLGLMILAVMAAGCGSDAPPPNAAGTEAGSKKEYTKEDAMKAVPARGTPEPGESR